MPTFRVFFSNHDYFSDRQFDTLDTALAYARSTCFQCQVYRNGDMVATWCPIGGSRFYPW